MQGGEQHHRSEATVRLQVKKSGVWSTIDQVTWSCLGCTGLIPDGVEQCEGSNFVRRDYRVRVTAKAWNETSSTPVHNKTENGPVADILSNCGN